jgi:peptidoglycan/LPS O-acetylase OafA/YrhL
MQTNHISPLTGVRFFAAAWVVVYHLQTVFTLLFHPLHVLEPISGQGLYAPHLFFLLSGFILSHNYFPTWSFRQHPKFVFYRFARLWPVHCLALLVIASYLRDFNCGLLKSFAEELFMVRSWFHPDFGWNSPAWSISAEWLAYLFVFPPACLLLRRVQSVWALGFTVAALTTANWFLPPLYAGRCSPILLLFPAGVALYRLSRLIKNPPAGCIQAVSLTLFLVYIYVPVMQSVLVLYASFALLIFGLSYQRGFLSRILSHRLIVFGGLASYSLYLTHNIVIRSYAYFCESVWMAGQPGGIRFLLLLFLLTALAATAVVSYKCLEEPANRGLRRLIAHRKSILNPETFNLNPKNILPS